MSDNPNLTDNTNETNHFSLQKNSFINNQGPFKLACSLKTTSNLTQYLKSKEKAALLSPSLLNKTPIPQTVNKSSPLITHKIQKRPSSKTAPQGTEKILLPQHWQRWRHWTPTLMKITPLPNAY